MNMFIKDSEQCAYCGSQYKLSGLVKTIDHIVPTSKGGFNVKENKIFCCSECNVFKADKLPEQFLDKIVYLMKNPSKIRFPYDLNRIIIMKRRVEFFIKYSKYHNEKVSEYKL